VNFTPPMPARDAPCLNLKHPISGCLGKWSAERQDRTVDTAIFSRVLYQLSYLGMRADFTIGGGCVKKMIGYRILLGEIFSINDDVISGYR
jgi:hypothetical protein